ncbi:hypothetical protein PF005_g28996 [Phytophthora fragariae]|uniref:Uncharacterized protein n=1 Tax=Phytophthora fragariae TaxID=53985 RepID=A0A6A3VGG2_9STRA|nr:hypothetical protein PF005_g28996 [Phytophthora fragariae]KAE9270819.1 hypothetical protein PF001_g28643 [Phytophthora fragariae]
MDMNDQGPLEHRANCLKVHATAGVIPRVLQQVFAVMKKRQMTYMDTLRCYLVVDIVIEVEPTDRPPPGARRKRLHCCNDLENKYQEAINQC